MSSKVHHDLAGLAQRLRETSAEFDPALVSVEDASAVVDAVTEIERAAGSLRCRAAARAAQGPTWKQEGCSSPDEWLADKTGTTRGEAQRMRQLGERLERHDETRRRLEAGEVSEGQAGIVAGAAEVNPDAEDSLLDAAERESIGKLREEAAKAKAEVSDAEERQAQIHAERHAASGTDEEGAYRFTARLSAFQGGIVEHVWRRFREAVARDAKRAGEHLNSGQVGADALVLMAQTALEGAEGGTGVVVLPEVRLHLLVDHEAWVRGHTEAAETCEIDGVGPITVAQARDLAGQQAFVTASTTDGADVVTVAHVGTTDPSHLSAEKVHEFLSAHGVDVQAIETAGRHVPAVLDTAITIRDRVCRAQGCNKRFGLERDHVVPVALGGATSYRQLQRLCWHHHRAKTNHDMAEIRARAGPGP